MDRKEWLKDTFRNAGSEGGRTRTNPRILLDDALRKFASAEPEEGGPILDPPDDESTAQV
jgi:hypothetical protein